MEKATMSKSPDTVDLATKVEKAKQAGYQVSQGDENDGPLQGRWWWTCVREGFSVDVIVGEGDFSTEAEAWEDAYADGFLVKPFNVTLPWNPSDAEEGDYATTVYTVDALAAIRKAAVEMADSKEMLFDAEQDREAYIESLVRDGGYVCETMHDAIYNLQVVFRDVLFPDGVVRDINTEALKAVLAENRTRIVSVPIQK